MKTLRVPTNVTLLIFVLGSLVFGQLPDPKEILLKSKAAIQNLQAISYHAEYYVVGTLKYGDMDAVLTPNQADVRFVRLLEDQFFGGKLSVSGPQPITKSSGPSSSYWVVYDGQKVVNIGEKEKTVFVNDPDQSGKYLLHNVFDLVPAELREPAPFDDVLNSGKLRYSGKAIVGGVACHIIQIGYSGDSSLKECCWFLGADDYLPRKVQNVGSGLPNQEIVRVLTLTGVKANPEIDRARFVVYAPEGFSVKKYELPDHPNAPGLAVGSTAPGWALRDANGKHHLLQDLRGQLVVLDFWATWCGPCRQAMPTLQKLNEKYEKKGVVVVGINTWESGDPGRFMKENGYKYLILLDGNEVAKSYQVSGIPTLYVIDPDGKILFWEVGYEGNAEQFYSKLEHIIISNLDKKSSKDQR